MKFENWIETEFYWQSGKYPSQKMILKVSRLLESTAFELCNGSEIGSGHPVLHLRNHPIYLTTESDELNWILHGRWDEITKIVPFLRINDGICTTEQMINFFNVQEPDLASKLLYCLDCLP